MDRRKLEYTQFQEYLVDYLTGEVDKRIEKFKYKLKEQEEKDDDQYWPDNMSYNLSHAQPSNSTGVGDPTASKALGLVEVYQCKEKYLKLYSTIKEIIEKYRENNNITYRELELLKIYLDIDEDTSLRKAAGEVEGLSYAGARKTAKGLYNGLMHYLNLQIRQQKGLEFYE